MDCYWGIGMGISFIYQTLSLESETTISQNSYKLMAIYGGCGGIEMLTAFLLIQKEFGS